jgi:hypothetical protein
MAEGMKFIRVRGRVVPVREKSYVGQKTQARNIKKRALSGAETGAKVGAVSAGALATGVLAAGVTAAILSKKQFTVSGKTAAKWAAGASAKWAALGAGTGAVLGAAFGNRKEQVKVKKKKWSSV